MIEQCDRSGQPDASGITMLARLGRTQKKTDQPDLWSESQSLLNIFPAHMPRPRILCIWAKEVVAFYGKS